CGPNRPTRRRWRTRPLTHGFAATLACSMSYAISYRSVDHSPGGQWHVSVRAHDRRDRQGHRGERMSPRQSDSRQRMVLSAAALLREHGASATSIDRMLAHSGAPRGSVYHHFPGGRAQLIDEAVALAGDFVAGLIETAARADDPVDALDAFFALWRDQLTRSDFRSGCPIVAVAVETNDGAPQLARSAAAVFG